VSIVGGGCIERLPGGKKTGGGDVELSQGEKEPRRAVRKEVRGRGGNLQSRRGSHQWARASLVHKFINEGER